MFSFINFQFSEITNPCWCVVDCTRVGIMYRDSIKNICFCNRRPVKVLNDYKLILNDLRVTQTNLESFRTFLYEITE